MPGSYRLVNYAVRPAKAIERRMLCAGFGRLHPFQSISRYRYVGFGSIYFTDFQLFHRELGITNMLSIERDAEARECFQFNRPYKCIRLRFDESTAVLPTLRWGTRSILWLDYDDRLELGMIGDIATVCGRANSGSMLVVSVNAQPDGQPDDETREKYKEETGKSFDLDEYRLHIMKKRLTEKLPAGVTGADLRGQGVARVFRDVIHNAIMEQLSIRNALLPDKDKMHYRQLFHFRYKDGAQMLTVGGLLFRSADENVVEACDFETLPFIRNGTEHYNIKAPCLTAREIRHLNSQLPRKSLKSVRVPGVPAADIKEYADVYRFFPTFSEILLA
jgi:hypothetical protein